MNEYDEKWEDRINALLDGELSVDEADSLKAKASDDHKLAQAIIKAYQLQQAMDAVHVERAPDSLRKRLQSIPRRHRDKPVFSLFQPRWAAAFAAIPLVLITYSLMQPKTPTDAEIAQARQDLVIAFAYLDRAGQFTGREIESVVGNTMSEAIAGSAIRNIKSQNKPSKEKEA